MVKFIGGVEGLLQNVAVLVAATLVLTRQEIMGSAQTFGVERGGGEDARFRGSCARPSGFCQFVKNVANATPTPSSDIGRSGAICKIASISAVWKGDSTSGVDLTEGR